MPVEIDEMTVNVNEQPSTRGDGGGASSEGSSESDSFANANKRELTSQWWAEVRLRTCAQGFDD
ncbi:MAG: hypothetical protein HUU55_00010 [Myxococcales bacterium]|nr:hypothetical protein [Myxococcales bacterium]